MRGEAWLWVISGLLLVSLLVREAQLFVIARILLLVAGVSYVWQRNCLTGLSYTRTLAQERAFFGEDVELTLEVANEKPLPLAWLEVEDVVPSDKLKISPSHIGPSHLPGRRLL